MARWFEEFGTVVFEGETGGGDYVDELWRDTADRGERLAGHRLSSAWSRGRRKKANAEGVVHDLLEIRESVRSLLKVHGVPRGTEIGLALLGQSGAGCASFRDIDTFSGPYLLLDKATYEMADPSEVLDIYCGIGLHEASHLNHTRKMFTRLKQGVLKGTRATLEGLLEDERIENLVRAESPGFGGYLDALKRALFEKRAYGGATSTPEKFAALPDTDKAMAIIFGTLRCPHTLTDAMREFKTLAGIHVYGELRSVLPHVPKTEDEVESMGREVHRLWKRIKEEYAEYAEKEPRDVAEDLLGGSAGGGAGGESGEDSGETAEGREAGDSAGEASGESRDGGAGGAGDTPEDRSEDSGEAEGDAEGDAEDRDAGDGESGEGEAGEAESSDDEPGAGASGEGSEPTPEEMKEIIERLIKQAGAEMVDRRIDATKKKIDKLREDAKAKGARTHSDEESVSEAEKESDMRDAEDAEGLLDKAKKELEALEKKREGRFDIRDLERMMETLDKVTDALDVEESSELVRATDERIEFGDRWEGSRPDGKGEGKVGSRRTVITHPKPDADAKRWTTIIHNEIKGHVARMRAVFRFRLGKRNYHERELVEGRLDRRMLGRAITTDRIFRRSFSKTDKGLAICLLMDESGSMGSSRRENRPARKALQLGYLIAESLRGVPGIETEVYSFTSCGSYDRDCLVRYLYGKENPHFESIAGYKQGCQNYDHMAIRTAGQLFEKNTENDNRLMLVLSDGSPSGADYGGSAARAAVKREVDALRKRGMKVMQVAIANFDSESMFGRGNVIRFTDLRTLINDMRKLITRVVRQATTRR